MTAPTDLLAVMRNWPRPIYVVIDGALLPDAPGLTAKADVFVRSLFIEHGDPATVQSGPWFAALDERHLESLMLIEGIETASVFWGGAVEEPVIFRHLRSLNLFDVPRPVDAPPDPFAADPETVLFRHWDPSVMALVLPVLEPAQRARLFGPMDALAIYAHSLDGAREAKRRETWPEPERGRIRLSVAQMEQITKAMVDRSRKTIAAYLRDTASAQTVTMDDRTLFEFIERSEIIGRSWGLVTEASFGRFAWLMLATQGGIATMEPVRAGIAAAGISPDQALRTLMDVMADQLRHQDILT